MNLNKVVFCLGFALALVTGFSPASYAATLPVRIALVAGSGSGMEQTVVDNMTGQLQENENIVVSTVNPDWLVTCRIEDHTDIAALTVRVNGTVTVTSVADGRVLNTFSAQANKQDFSTGGPTPLNKALVDSAVKELTAQLCQRSVQPIEDAVVVEIATRDKIIQAENLANIDKYDDAMAILLTIDRGTTHYWPACQLASRFQMEKDALELITQAKAEDRAGHDKAALVALHQVNPNSKRYRLAQGMIATFSHPTLAKNKTHPKAGAKANTNAELKALEAQKQALDAQRKAIDAQETAIRSKDKP